MEFIAMGFLIGVVFSIVMIGAGVLYADYMAKRQHYGGNNLPVCVPCGDNNGDNSRHTDKHNNKEG